MMGLPAATADAISSAVSDTTTFVELLLPEIEPPPPAPPVFLVTCITYAPPEPAALNVPSEATDSPSPTFTPPNVDSVAAGRV